MKLQPTVRETVCDLECGGRFDLETKPETKWSDVYNFFLLKIGAPIKIFTTPCGTGLLEPIREEPVGKDSESLLYYEREQQRRDVATQTGRRKRKSRPSVSFPPSGVSRFKYLLIRQCLRSVN